MSDTPTRDATTRPDPAGEAARFLEAHPDIRAVDAIFADMAGVIRGKRLPARELPKLYTGGTAMPGSSFLLDAQGENHDPCGYGFSDGDPDALAVPVPGSLVPVPWSDEPQAQVMLRFFGDDGSPYMFEPRTVLARAAEPLHAMGLTPVVAFELEFYLIDRERAADGSPLPPISPVTGARERATQVYGMSDVDAYGHILNEITRACAAQGVETGAVTAEYAPGQFEINLAHVADPVRAADRCVMFQRAVRAVARRHGLQATFMAKPYPAQTGSGMHVHCSLVDEAGANVFAGGEGAHGVNAALSGALRGTLDVLPESMAFLAPNPNNYRRFQPNTFVPLQRSWAFENRSVAVRVPLGEGASRRIEHRMAGADANPYLVLASILAGMHHGIAGGLDAGPPSEGNAGAAHDRGVPWRSRRAVEALERAAILPRYIDQHYLDVFSEAKHAELDTFEARITAAEYEWFLKTE